MTGQVTLNFTPTTTKPRPPMSPEASDLVKNIKDAGSFGFDEKTQDELGQVLPQNYQPAEVSSALSIYAKGGKSEDLSQLNGFLSGEEKESLKRTNYFLKNYENGSRELTENIQAANSYPALALDQAPQGAIPTDTRIVFQRQGGILKPILKEGAGRASGIAKSKVQKFALKSFRKVGVKFSKKIATKLGVKLGAQALGSIAPGVGNIVAVIATEVLPRIKKLLTSALSKIGIKTAGDRRKQFAILGSLIALAGLATGIVPVMIFGGAMALGFMFAYFGGVAMGVGVSGAVGTVFYGFASVSHAVFGAPILIAIIGAPLLVAIFLFIINTGAFIVPPDPSQIPGLVESPYIDVTKVVVEVDEETDSDEEASSSLEFENIDLPLTIAYTITVRAKQGTLTNISFEHTCNVIKEDSPPPCSVPTPPTPVSISPVDGGEFVFTFTETYGSRFTDSLVIDTFTVTADVEGEVTGTEAAASASVTIGDPPDQCPQGWPVGGNFNQGAHTRSSHRNAEAIDIGANLGTSVTARHAGIARVRSITQGGPFGITVEIESVCPDDPFFSRYAHLSSVFVKTGDGITLGQIIGEVGDTGTGSRGNHLHYEFRDPSGPKSIGNPPNMLFDYIPFDLPRGCVEFGPCGSIILQ